MNYKDPRRKTWKQEYISLKTDVFQKEYEGNFCNFKSLWQLLWKAYLKLILSNLWASCVSIYIDKHVQQN